MIFPPEAAGYKKSGLVTPSSAGNMFGFNFLAAYHFDT